MKYLKTLATGAAIAAAGATPAFAHVGLGDHDGILLGFMHPVGGLDHVLAMVSVGLLAASLGGRALWLLPASFMTMMAAGGALGFAGIALPGSEAAIAVSVLALGAVLALGLRLQLGVAMAMCGFFAIFHGIAHGSELPAQTSAIGFAAGFLSATLALHLAGIGLGVALSRLPAIGRVWIARLGGAAIAAAGTGLLLQ